MPWDKLIGYMLERKETLENFTPPLVQAGQFGLGQSNPTYYLEDSAGHKFVLRRKPAGKLQHGAHQIDREYRVQKAVGDQGFPVPKMYLYCKDPSIAGTEFYIMQYRTGRVLGQLGVLDVPVSDRWAYWESAIKTLALLHSYDHKKIGLAGYGKDSGYYPRSIQNWTRLSNQQAAVTDPKTGEKNYSLESLDEQLEFFHKYMPKDEVSVAHLDYMMHNMMFHPTKPEIVAVLDWEISTIGHPLADMGYFLQHFYRQWPSGFQGMPADKMAGMPTADDLLRMYEKYSGRKERITRFEYHVAFSMYRSTVIAQGIAGRVIAGTAASAAATQVKNSVPETNAKCLKFIRSLKAKWDVEDAKKPKL